MAEPEADSPSRNFSGITTRDQAEKLVQQGELEWLRLLPAEFGGTDDPKNQVAVPKRAAREKRRVDEGSVRPLMEQGKVSKYTAEPVYEGESFIPTAIKVQATEPGSFSATVGVWGSGLAQAEKGRRPSERLARPAPPKGAAPAAGADKEFKLVRSAPAAEKEGLGLLPFAVVGILAVVGVGGWFATRGGDPAKDGKKPPAPVTDPGATTAAPPTATEEDPPAVKVFLTNRLDWLEEQGNLTRALQEAEAKLKEYPKAAGLRRRVEELRAKTGTAAPSGDVGADIGEAEALIDGGKLAEAIAKLDAILERDPPDEVAGRGYFARGVAHYKAGHKLDAHNDVESAAAAKFDAARCEELRRAVAGMR